MNAIELINVTKRYGDFVAVDGIDFTVDRGETFGFLGPNGAGKTSTMRMIGCVSPVTGGTLRVFGLDPAKDGVEIRGRLGVVPQEDSLDLELTDAKAIRAERVVLRVKRTHHNRRYSWHWDCRRRIRSE